MIERLGEGGEGAVGLEREAGCLDAWAGQRFAGFVDFDEARDGDGGGVGQEWGERFNVEVAVVLLGEFEVANRLERDSDQEL